MIIIEKFAYSLHALQRMDGFWLTRREIEIVIKRGMKWKEENRDIWHANIGNIEVVFKKINNIMFIVTVYIDRRIKWNVFYATRMLKRNL